MEMSQNAPKTKIRGILNAESWDPSGHIAGLSIYTNEGYEYKLLETPLVQRLAHFVWDEVELEGQVLTLSSGEPAFEVNHYRIYGDWPSLIDENEEDFRGRRFYRDLCEFDSKDRLQDLPWIEWDEDPEVPLSELFEGNKTHQKRKNRMAA